jgi:hypothetical protein
MKNNGLRPSGRLDLSAYNSYVVDAMPRRTVLPTVSLLERTRCRIVNAQ